MELRKLDEFQTLEELVDYQKDIASEIQRIDSEAGVRAMPPETAEEFRGLKEHNEALKAQIVEVRARKQYVADQAAAGNIVSGAEPRAYTPPSVIRRQSEEDIYDLSTITTSISNPQSASRELRDRALKANETARYHSVTDRSKVQEHVGNLLDRDEVRGELAKRMLLTGSPTYRSAFQKTLAGLPLNHAETNAMANARALSLTGASGGFAVPYTLDPTIIPTSNGTVNPYRQVARVVQITGDEWRGVSSGAITASYTAESVETTDNAPTLTQPTISTERATAFVPMSIEISMDWPTVEQEMGGLLADAKDLLEAQKFTSGSGTNEPFGLLTGVTNTVAAAAGQTFTVGNLYSLVGALPARYRPRAAFMGNLAVINRIRQFDTSGGANLWETLANDAPPRLLGRPFYESNEMADVATSVKFLVFGDFSRYVIVDRMGMTIELLPHLLGANRRPTGERGLFAMWRNGAKVVDANAFRTLLGTA